MSSILDATPFPWAEPASSELHRTLVTLYPVPASALLVAEKAGLSRADFSAGQEPYLLWAAILSKAGNDGLTRNLAKTVHGSLKAPNPALSHSLITS